jgi:hypothetical protein
VQVWKLITVLSREQSPAQQNSFVEVYAEVQPQEVEVGVAGVEELFAAPG